MEDIWRDIRFALRGLQRSPVFAVFAILTLALGIGATTAVLSVVSEVLIKEAPYPHADRLVRLEGIKNADGEIETWPTSYDDYIDWREGTSEVLEEFAVHSYSQPFNILTSGEAERVEGEIVNAAYFRLLGLELAAGRAFTDEEEQVVGAPYAMILGHSLWQRRFAGDPGVIGQTLIVNEKSYEIVGVMPRGFRGLTDTAEIWLPLMMANDLFGAPRFLERRGVRWLLAAARLQEGVTIERAQSVLDSVNSRLQAEFTDTNENMGTEVKTIRDELYGEMRFALLTLFGSALFVLLISCTTVAVLLLTRAISRQREIAVRVAQGATRWRLIRMLVTESLILALISTAVGLTLAHWATGLLVEASTVNFQSYMNFGVKASLAAMVVGLAVICGFAFGLAPAFLGTRASSLEALREGASSYNRTSQRLQGLLVIAEVALALFLLIGAGLMIKGFQQLRQQNLGLNPDGLFSIRVDLKGDTYAANDDMARLAGLYLERLEGLSGVEEVVAVGPAMPGDNWFGISFIVEDRITDEDGGVSFFVFHKASPNYFQTLGIPLLAGRDFSKRDTPDSELVAIVSQELADQTWPGEDPIGKRVRFGRRDPDAPWRTVVGVVGNVQHEQMQEMEWPGPDIYLPILQFAPTLIPRFNFLIRPKAEDPLALAGPVQAELAAVEPLLPSYDVSTISEKIRLFQAKDRFLVLLMTIFAGLALFLAIAGLYGVVSHGVLQRRREIGLRLAIGGERRDIQWLIVARAARLVAVGLGVGVLASLALSHLFESLLYGVDAFDWTIYALTAVLLFFISLLAAWGPARRATKIQPTAVLRAE